MFMGIFFKNAWVTEDAYINFRSIEQLYAGNGPNWNPGERVQVFTSPLWFGLLAFGRLFSRDLFLVSIFTSFLCCFTLLLLVQRSFSPLKFFIFVLLITLSQAISDFMTGGLENSLCYLLITIFGLAIIGKLPTNYLFLSFSLALITRHDLAIILILPLIYYLYSRKVIWRLKLLSSLVPVFLWSFFSLFYYGSLFPNSYYAKLPESISSLGKITNAGQYFHASLVFDTISIVLIFLAPILCFRFKNKNSFPLLLGVFANLIYLFSIGGDYMLGRFIANLTLLAIIIIITCDYSKLRISTFYFSLTTIFIIVFSFTDNPYKTSLQYSSYRVMYNKISDERGIYFPHLSLSSYFTTIPFPNHPWAIAGREFAASSDLIKVSNVVGMLGYFARLDQVIIDPLAITSPFLARLPSSGSNFTPGHYPRNLPDGYIESFQLDLPRMKDSQLNELYQKVSLITRKPLLEKDRIKTIIKVNLFGYN